MGFAASFTKGILDPLAGQGFVRASHDSIALRICDGDLLQWIEARVSRGLWHAFFQVTPLYVAQSRFPGERVIYEKRIPVLGVLPVDQHLPILTVVESRVAAWFDDNATSEDILRHHAKRAVVIDSYVLPFMLARTGRLSAARKAFKERRAEVLEYCRRAGDKPGARAFAEMDACERALRRPAGLAAFFAAAAKRSRSNLSRK